MPKVGVFDSGIGGLSVARAIQEALPDAQVVFASDKEHMPYGDKKPAQVLGFVVPIVEKLVDHGCKAIVIACNSVTTNHIEELRRRFTVPLVGIEPMVKPAAAKTKSGVIAVCATPLTLSSRRYAWLKETYTRNVKVLEPDCSQWAYMVEHNQLNEAKLLEQIDGVCKAGADVIVLGCTHYHWIEDIIRRMAAERALVIQPEQSVIAQLKRILGSVY
jgi:glutamate racemase